MPTMKQVSVKKANSAEDFKTEDIGADAINIDVQYDASGNIITDVSKQTVDASKTKILPDVLKETVKNNDSRLSDARKNPNALTFADNSKYDGSAAVTINAAKAGAAPVSHASTATTYGVGSTSNYGHVKISETYKSKDSGSGIASAQSAVYNVYNSPKIATTSAVGAVKPDGDTITIDADGTLHGSSAVFISVDKALSSTSENPVQNKAIVEELKSYAKKTDLSSVYKYKGSVEAEANLPTTGMVVGDTYDIRSTDMNVAWDGSKWDKLGTTVNLSGYAKKTDIPTIPSSLPANGGNSTTVNGHTVNADVPSGAKFTDTWRPLGSGASDACAGNDPRLSDSRKANGGSADYATSAGSADTAANATKLNNKTLTFSLSGSTLSITNQ